MEINKSMFFNVVDYSVNRIEGMIIGSGENEKDAINDFIDKAVKAKKASEENVHILYELIKEANKLINT